MRLRVGQETAAAGDAPPPAAHPRSGCRPLFRLIGIYAMMVHALCDFATLGILIGGLNQFLPERRAEVAGLGWRALITVTPATLTSGAVVGLLTP